MADTRKSSKKRKSTSVPARRRTQVSTASRRRVQASTAVNRRKARQEKGKNTKVEIKLPTEPETAKVEVKLPKKAQEPVKAEAKKSEPVIIKPKIQKFNIEDKADGKLEAAIESVIIPMPRVAEREILVEPEPVVEPPVHEAVQLEQSQQEMAQQKSSEFEPETETKPLVIKTKVEKPAPVRPTAQQIKQQEIDKALASAARKSAQQVKSQKSKKSVRVGMDWKRIVLALSCAAAAVFAIAYFVNLNAPDVSLKVAAMQTGIDASYPPYTPRDYSLTDITSESGKVTLNFKNPSTGDGYSLVEEKSSWDSNALLNNYVKSEFNDYTTIKEQGLTIYISGSKAAWVNGGVVYKINVTQGSLTKKQITTIATSL